MIFDEQRAFELSRSYIEERLAEAAREQLLREAERAAGPQPKMTTRLGGTLIRTGRWLEALGGVPQPNRRLNPSGYPV
jgi:hypothetical protein